MNPETLFTSTGASTASRRSQPQKSADRSPAVARRIGDWQLTDAISAGDLTATYLAHPYGSEPVCHYVLKTVAEETPETDLAMKLLQREVLVSQEVSHPHLIPVLDAQLRNEPNYLVMPRLPGDTLRRLLDRQGRLEGITALWITRQVAQGLAALHGHHWLHADIKPENIMIAPDGHVTLIDLGFARHFQESGSACNRRIQGTFNYIAPEMITSAHGAGASSDLYSLGATLYEMLVGQPPFQGTTLADLARAHRQQRPAPLQERVPEVAEAVAALVMRLLAKQPVRREASALALVDQLVKLEIGALARCP